MDNWLPPTRAVCSQFSSSSPVFCQVRWKKARNLNIWKVLPEGQREIFVSTCIFASQSSLQHRRWKSSISHKESGFGKGQAHRKNSTMLGHPNSCPVHTLVLLLTSHANSYDQTSQKLLTHWMYTQQFLHLQWPSVWDFRRLGSW